jgi:hypothetical protein
MLVQAFNEQTHSIGWEQFFRGRISAKWSSAYRSLKAGGKQQEVDAEKWAAALIQGIWEYSRSIWKIRNAVVHGATVEEARAKKHGEL